MNTEPQIATNLPTNLPTLIPLPKSYPPTKVMADANQLRLRVVDYFSLINDPTNEGPPRHPTPPGLAMALGLRSFDALLRIMQVAEDDPSVYPEESLEVLHVARSYLEDHYISHGLREMIPTQFLKFLLSAYFNRSEKTIQETLNAKDNQLNINILGIGAPLPLASTTAPTTPLEAPTIDVHPEALPETLTITYAATDDDLEAL
jgi:hypothetical protein